MRKFCVMMLAAVVATGLTMCTSKTDDKVYDASVDSIRQELSAMPEYPGGNEAMAKFLGENLKYPEKAQLSGIEGRVLVSFVVETDGSIGDVNVKEGADAMLDAEAVRVIKAMPKWTPGKNKQGETVRVLMTCPVNFALQSDDEADVHASYPGGNEALAQFLCENLKYPAECEAAGIKGRVLVQFVVTSEGDIANPIIEKSVDPRLDAEALRVIKLMPKWIPAEKDGKKIAVKYHAPINFAL